MKKENDLSNLYYSNKEKQRNTLRDKRIKHYEKCDNCQSYISKNKYNKNQGLCDLCIQSIN